MSPSAALACALLFVAVHAAVAQSPAPSSQPGASASPAAQITAYQNYDFVPGDTILFADDFRDTADGEFPQHWSLVKGQAVVNTVSGYQALLLTDGNYATVAPRIKTPSYLGAQFTLEYDVFGNHGAYPLYVMFKNPGGTAQLYTDRNGAEFTASGVRLGAAIPAESRGDAYENKWHHIALVYRKPQLKVYVDQDRILTVPDTNFEPATFTLAGIGDPKKPIIFRNVTLASGGGMKMLGKKCTDAKIIAHGINFDVDKATLRPESMGTLNQIKSLLAADPTLTFEVDGHTDNSGTAPHNLTLSSQRATAVKAQLVLMGIDAARLTPKGLGDTMPLGPNDTPEGKANNRRVEFVRTSPPAA